MKAAVGISSSHAPPPPPSVFAGHVKEVILLVHAALEHGDDEAVALAEQVVDGLFRDYDVPGV